MRAYKFAPGLWHFSLQEQKHYDYVTNKKNKKIHLKSDGFFLWFFLFFLQTGRNRYLHVYPLALRLYHPSDHYCPAFGFDSREVLQGGNCL